MSYKADFIPQGESVLFLFKKSYCLLYIKNEMLVKIN